MALDLNSFFQFLKRFNEIPSQVKAITQMTPPMAQSYRNTVDKTVPRIPQLPKSVVGGLARPALDSFVNAIPNAVGSLAKLPAARNPWQAVGDVASIGAGAAQGYGLLHGATSVANQVSQNPQWLTNQRGDINPAFNASVDAMTSRPMSGPPLDASRFANLKPGMANTANQVEINEGWLPGMKSKFDVAMLTKDIPTIKQLLPSVPTNYRALFGDRISRVLMGLSTD